MAKRHHIQASKRAAKERRAKANEQRRRQRRADRRRTTLTIGGALVVGLLLIAAVGYSRWEPTRIGHLTDPSKAARQAGCTGVRNDRSAGGTHETRSVKYRGVPPSSGHHNPDPLPDTPQFYTRDAKVPMLTERAVHNLEHGFVVGWYDDKLPKAQVDKLQSASASAVRFIAVPWTRGTFTGDRHLVLTAWTRSQRCRTVSTDAIKSFTDKYVNAKTAPETNGPGGTPASPTPAPTPRRSPAPRPSSSPR